MAPMTARVSASQRRKSSLVAEQEILRFADDHALWHRHIHGVTLDPAQILKMVEMDRHRNTVDFSCRRTGKTFVKELYCLKWLACNPHEDEGIVAPRVQQSLTNLGYHTDAIRRSSILSAFIATKNGRRQIKDTSYGFANGSGCAAYGIMSQIDGDSITVASIEEVDDCPHDRLTSRFLPMLGSTRRPGVDHTLKPQIRITGVYKGADVLTSLIDSGVYHTLPIVDVYLGLELGSVNDQWAVEMRAQNSEGEWIRQFLCKNVQAQNWIWEKHVRRAMAVGLEAGIEIAGPLPGVRYARRGLIAMGYDHGGHGESGTASKSALVVMEQIGSFSVIVYCRTWHAATDDRVIERDLAGLWDYFRPDYAMGDAYGVGMMTSLNDRLYANGLTLIDRRTIGDGQSTASTWSQWPFAPIRFEGQTKHSMASALRTAFHHGQAAIPWFDEDDKANCGDWIALLRQLPNMKADATRAGYSSFKMADPKVGDDLFDAACAAIWALVTRGVNEIPVVVGRRTQTREQLMGTPGRLIEVAG
jgi:hypothetical protein